MVTSLRESLKWLRQTIHQSHHQGPIEDCKMNTCSHVGELLATCDAAEANAASDVLAGMQGSVDFLLEELHAAATKDLDPTFYTKTFPATPAMEVFFKAVRTGVPQLVRMYREASRRPSLPREQVPDGSGEKPGGE